MAFMSNNKEALLKDFETLCEDFVMALDKSQKDIGELKKQLRVTEEENFKLKKTVTSNELKYLDALFNIGEGVKCDFPDINPSITSTLLKNMDLTPTVFYRAQTPAIRTTIYVSRHGVVGEVSNQKVDPFSSKEVLEQDADLKPPADVSSSVEREYDVRSELLRSVVHNEDTVSAEEAVVVLVETRREAAARAEEYENDIDDLEEKSEAIGENGTDTIQQSLGTETRHSYSINVNDSTKMKVPVDSASSFSACSVNPIYENDFVDTCPENDTSIILQSKASQLLHSDSMVDSQSPHEALDTSVVPSAQEPSRGLLVQEPIVEPAVEPTNEVKEQQEHKGDHEETDSPSPLWLAAQHQRSGRRSRKLSFADQPKVDIFFDPLQQESGDVTTESLDKRIATASTVASCVVESHCVAEIDKIDNLIAATLQQQDAKHQYGEGPSCRIGYHNNDHSDITADDSSNYIAVSVLGDDGWQDESLRRDDGMVDRHQYDYHEANISRDNNNEEVIAEEHHQQQRERVAVAYDDDNCSSFIYQDTESSVLDSHSPGRVMRAPGLGLVPHAPPMPRPSYTYNYNIEGGAPTRSIVRNGDYNNGGNVRGITPATRICINGNGNNNRGRNTSPGKFDRIRSSPPSNPHVPVSSSSPPSRFVRYGGRFFSRVLDGKVIGVTSPNITAQQQQQQQQSHVNSRLGGLQLSQKNQQAAQGLSDSNFPFFSSDATKIDRNNKGLLSGSGSTRIQFSHAALFRPKIEEYSRLAGLSPSVLLPNEQPSNNNYDDDIYSAEIQRMESNALLTTIPSASSTRMYEKGYSSGGAFGGYTVVSAITEFDLEDATHATPDTAVGATEAETIHPHTSTIGVGRSQGRAEATIQLPATRSSSDPSIFPSFGAPAASDHDIMNWIAFVTGQSKPKKARKKMKKNPKHKKRAPSSRTKKT